MQQHSRGQNSMQDTLQPFQQDDQDQESRDRIGILRRNKFKQFALGETNVTWFVGNMRNDVLVLLRVE